MGKNDRFGAADGFYFRAFPSVVGTKVPPKYGIPTSGTTTNDNHFLISFIYTYEALALEMNCPK